MKSNYPEHEKKRHLIGLGLDNTDKHKRITKGEDFFLAGGSEETHEVMVEKTIKISEKLKKRGKSISTASDEEFIDTAHDVGFKTAPSNYPQNREN